MTLLPCLTAAASKTDHVSAKPYWYDISPEGRQQDTRSRCQGMILSVFFSDCMANQLNHYAIHRFNISYLFKTEMMSWVSRHHFVSSLPREGLVQSVHPSHHQVRRDSATCPAMDQKAAWLSMITRLAWLPSNPSCHPQHGTPW